MERIKQFLLKNNSEKQTAMKNTIWLFFGEIIGRLFKLVIIIFATRKLGIEGWGIFSYGIAFISLFFILCDLGVNTFTTREMSKNSADKYKYLSSSTIIKISLMLIFFALSLLLAPHLGKIKLGFEMIMVLSILYLSDGIREFALSINRSLEKMEREAFSKILMNLIITILGIILLIKNATPFSLAIAYAIGSIVSSLFIFWSIKDVFKKIEWKISKEDIKIIYNFSWPIIIISLYSFIFNIDSIMLGQMKSATDVGLYSAAQRLVQFTAIIPSFIAMAIFPILSKNEDNDEKITNIFEKIMITIFAIGIPFSIGGFLLNEKIMSLMFGPAFISGGLTLGILMFSILASFPNIILTNVIFSKNLQKIFIATTSFGVILNIILNLILIPKFGAVGAAISVTATQLLIMIFNWQKLKKIMPFSVIPKIGKILVSCLIMGIIVLILKLVGVNLIMIIAVAIIIYFLSLLIIKEPTINEILLLIKK